MEKYVLEYVRRTPKGTGAARRLRREGRVPGILYGHNQDTVPLALDVDSFQAFLRSGNRAVTLRDGPRAEMALVKDVQHDALGSEVVHVDFARVDSDERVQVSVPVELHGTPKGAAEGGVVDQVQHELNIECLVFAIPESIRAEIAGLDIEESLNVRDLAPPEGVALLDDPDTVVVVVHAPRVEEEAEEEAEGAEAAAEPEVIGRELEPGEAVEDQAESGEE